MSNTFPLEELRSLLEKARAADAELKQFGEKIININGTLRHPSKRLKNLSRICEDLPAA